MNILPLASWTKLAVALVLLAALEGCSTTTPDQDMRRAALWAAATECASGKGSIKVDRIDSNGRAHVTFLPGGQQDLPAFTACYNRKTSEKLAVAIRAAGPARIVESPSSAESSGARPSSRVTSVPIQRFGNMYLVPVVLNENRTATFVLDTGANHTMVTPDLVRRAGLESAYPGVKSKARMATGQEVEVSWTRLKSIAVGLARIDNINVSVYAFDLWDRDVNPPTTVDGILGADFLWRFTMTVNPKAGTLTLQLDDLPVKR